ncbi:HD domain-containing protein [Umezawaea sp. Da 62-37]|uniref:HD domain-containing protein n=1 Tax=Umezawaea sp. Da 62-37 TaxID=3075927 RepID=UPI0028F6F0EB|nr:HD domain-containing protein [Umezawaea sp. Da 62-37]WNV89181.1 HD domain-containing protein [Umezawaea sp. Da 62-37]
MITIPAKLTDPLARETLDFLHASVAEPIANHSIRAYVYAEFLVDHWNERHNKDYDPDTLFFAATLHDLGLGTAGANHPDRFEVAGADLAVDHLQKNGVAQPTIDRVWDAIALHTSLGIAQRKGLISKLVTVATGMDFGADSEPITDAMAATLHAHYPRLDSAKTMITTITTQARTNPAKAPLASLTHYLTRTAHLGPDPTIASRWDS